MDWRKRLGLRLHRVLLYWGLLAHPRGRTAAKRRYTPTGSCREPEAVTDANDTPTSASADR